MLYRFNFLRIPVQSVIIQQAIQKIYKITDFSEAECVQIIYLIEIF